MRSLLRVSAAAVVLIIGCSSPALGPSAGPTSRPSGTSTPGVPNPTSALPADTSGVSFDPALTPIVDLAVADLAARLRRDEADIEVVSAGAVTWPDGSLGCPEPGMMYTQALVNGSHVILGIDNRSRVFAYHAGPDGQPFLCPSTEPDGGHDFVPPPGFDT